MSFIAVRGPGAAHDNNVVAGSRSRCGDCADQRTGAATFLVVASNNQMPDRLFINVSLFHSLSASGERMVNGNHRNMNGGILQTIPRQGDRTGSGRRLIFGKDR